MGWAKNLRLFTNSCILRLASSFETLNGRITSGTAPLGICLLIESVFLHQWHLACVDEAVSTTTSAPQLSHFKVTTSFAASSIFFAPEPTTFPLNSDMSPSSARYTGSKSCLQKLQRSLKNLYIFIHIHLHFCTAVSPCMRLCQAAHRHNLIKSFRLNSE